MTIIPESLRTEMAEAQQEYAATYWAGEVKKFLRGIPKHVITPMYMALVAGALQEQTASMSPNAGDCADDHLQDLLADMKRFHDEG